MIKYIRYLVYKYDQKNRRLDWQKKQRDIVRNAIEELRWIQYPKLLSGISLDTGELVHDFNGWKTAYDATEKRIKDLKDKAFVEMPEHLNTKTFEDWKNNILT
jgi:predicted esterase YcpF (UPF0227 family)